MHDFWCGFNFASKLNPKIRDSLLRINGFRLKPEPAKRLVYSLLDQKSSVLLYRLSVEVYRAATSEVLYHVPVYGRDVLASGRLVRPAYGEGYCSAYLLVKEDV